MVVLGAGPAGLGAGLAAARAGAEVVVAEAQGRVGGLCVTRRRDGFGYDLGGHIPFVRDPGRRAWLEGLLDGDLRWVDRPVSCVRDGRLTRGRYLDQRPDVPERPGEPDDTARGFLSARFGPDFTDAALRPYLEKIDGVPLERVPAERVRRLLEDQAAPDGFWFPRSGIGQLMDAMADAIVAAGGEVRLHTRASALRLEGGRVGGVDLDGAGPTEPIATGQVVVSLPAGLAAGIAVPPAPASARAAVRMRAVALVYLTLDRERLTAEPWIQVDDDAVPFSRAFEPANWSPDLAPSGRTVIGFECYCDATDDDPVWSLDDDALAAACARALAEPLGWLDDPALARPLEVVRLPHAYPVPDLEQMPAVMAPAQWLTGQEGVHLAPGAAVIEAIAAGERAAAEALSGAAAAGPVAPDASIP